MKRITLMWIVLTGALLAPTAGFAQISCSREGLQRAVDLYIAAQTKGDTSGMPLAMGLGYMENVAPADINTGVIKKPMKIDHHRSLLDTATCQTFTEVIVTNKENPYVLGTRLRINHDKIAEIEILWTTTGYWLFNADAYLKYSSAEKWDTIPANQRDTRDTLVAAANAYLDAFLEQKKDLVPWGYPCNRTEGGMHTGNGSPTDSCDVGVPSWCEHIQPPLRGGRDNRCGRGVLYLRRRKRKRRQRCARYSSLPRGEWQAALRSHADASVAVEFPGRAGWWPERWSWRSRCTSRRRGCSHRSGPRNASNESTVVSNRSQGAARGSRLPLRNPRPCIAVLETDVCATL